MWHDLVLFLFWFRFFFTCTVRLLFHSLLEKVEGACSFKIGRPKSRRCRWTRTYFGRRWTLCRWTRTYFGRRWTLGVLKIRQFSWASYVYHPYCNTCNLVFSSLKLENGRKKLVCNEIWILLTYLWSFF